MKKGFNQNNEITNATKIIPHKNNLCSQYAEKMISIRLNRDCNCSCEFCIDKNGSAEKAVDVEKIAKAAISLTEFSKVIITGGETFLHFDELIELVKKLRPHKTYIAVNTNGSLLTAEKVSQLNGLIDEIQISVHHWDPQVNGAVFKRLIDFENIKTSLKEKQFMFSINTCITNVFNEASDYNKFLDLCKNLGADKWRVTELKNVPDNLFVPANLFFKNLPKRTDDELITKGCTAYFSDQGIKISVKRVCKYARGANAKAFSCCFIDAEGHQKVEGIESVKNTFRVVYGNGMITEDWIRIS